MTNDPLAIAHAQKIVSEIMAQPMVLIELALGDNKEKMLAISRLQEGIWWAVQSVATEKAKKPIQRKKKTKRRPK